MAVWRPTNATALTPLRTPFGLLADSVDAELASAAGIRQLRNYRWTDQGARNSQTGMATGDFGYQVDTQTFYVRQGSIWAKLVPDELTRKETVVVPTGGLQNSAAYIATTAVAAAPYPRRITLELSGSIAMSAGTPAAGQILLSLEGATAVVGNPLGLIGGSLQAVSYSKKSIFLLPANVAGSARAQTSVNTGQMAFSGIMIIEATGTF